MLLPFVGSPFLHRLPSSAHWFRLDHNSYDHFRHLNWLCSHLIRLPKAQQTKAYFGLSRLHQLWQTICNLTGFSCYLVWNKCSCCSSVIVCQSRFVHFQTCPPDDCVNLSTPGFICSTVLSVTTKPLVANPANINQRPISSLNF